MGCYFRFVIILFSFFLLVADVAFSGPIRIAIPSFSNNTDDQNLDFLREKLADMLAEKLANSEEIEVIKRGRMKEVTKEMTLPQVADGKESMRLRVGRILGAEKMVYGYILQIELGKSPLYKLSIQMENTRSGAVTNEWSTTGKLPDLSAMVTVLAGNISDYMKQETAIRDLTELVHTNPAFKIELWTDKKRYRIGDQITIYFRSEKDCYLTLIDITTSGKFYILFPNSYEKNNFIESGKTYSIPAARHPFAITVGEPRGFERLKAIATLENVDLTKTRPGKGNQVFTRLRKPVKVIRALNIVLADTKKLIWADAYCEVIIE